MHFLNNKNSCLERYYRIIDIRDAVSKNHLEIKTDITDYIESYYSSKYRFIYRNKKLYINVWPTAELFRIATVSDYTIYRPEHLWNILENVDNNQEVIKFVTKVLSCLP